MKRVLIVTALAVAASCLSAVTPAHAWTYCGDSDEVYPVVHGATISPTSATIGRANKQLTVTVSASDDCAVTRVDVTFQRAGSPSEYPIYLTNLTRISGTPQSGTWRGTRTIEDQQPGGVWLPTVTAIDSFFNDAHTRTAGQLRLRHETSLTLNKPTAKVSKKVTLTGRLRAYGDFGTWRVQIQKHAPGKPWSAVRSVTTNTWGDFRTTVEIKGTTYVRAVHFADNTSVAAKSESYKVKKK